MYYILVENKNKMAKKRKSTKKKSNSFRHASKKRKPVKKTNTGITKNSHTRKKTTNNTNNGTGCGCIIAVICFLTVISLCSRASVTASDIFIGAMIIAIAGFAIIMLYYFVIRVVTFFKLWNKTKPYLNENISFSEAIRQTSKDSAASQKLAIDTSNLKNKILKMRSNLPFDSSVDTMDGYKFEHYCGDLLQYNGFTDVTVTQDRGDKGVDIIAQKNGQKYAIQCKRSEKSIGNKAIQEIYTGKDYYDCNVAAVLTNNTFTNSALDMAEKTNVILWDRQILNEFQQNANTIIDVQLKPNEPAISFMNAKGQLRRVPILLKYSTEHSSQLDSEQAARADDLAKAINKDILYLLRELNDNGDSFYMLAPVEREDINNLVKTFSGKYYIGIAYLK